MAVIHCHFFPSGLGMRTSFVIVLPEPEEGFAENNVAAPERKYPVLWLLHGAGGNGVGWLYDTDVVDLSQRYGIAVVMPDAQNSCYLDMAHGPKWFTYLTQSLPQFVYEHFPVSNMRKDNYVAGASMGGYGALLFALSRPTQYAAAAAMGSGVSIPQKYASGLIPKSADGFMEACLTAAFGNDPAGVIGGDCDCYALARRAKENGVELPRLLSCCGKKDFSYGENVQFRDYMHSLGHQLDWEESDDTHSLEAWRAFLPAVMRWLTA